MTKSRAMLARAAYLMNCYTYFNADEKREGDGELLRLWRVSWERRGWEPKILTPRSAILHPRYKEALDNHPDALRWLAFEQAGAGWFCEFDCINYSFSPRTPDVDFSRSANYPAMFWASKAAATRLTDDILSPKYQYLAGLTTDITPYCLDMSVTGWETAPVLHVSAQSIFRHFGCEIPAWQVVAQLDRKF